MSSRYDNHDDTTSVRKRTHLLTLFVVLSFITMSILLVLVGVVQNRIMRGLAIENARTDSTIATSVVKILQAGKLIKRVNGVERLELAAADFSQFDRQTRQILNVFNVVTLKFFDDSSRIIYSTDWNTIGDIEEDNEHLLRALNGEVYSIVKKQEIPARYSNEVASVLDVMDTYVPVFGSEKQIIGSCEINLDISPYIADSRAWLFRSLTDIGAIMLIMFGLLSGLMWKAARTIASHTIEIESANNELRKVNNSLSRLATTDELTGLMNRRAAMQRLEEAWAQSDRNQTPLCCILIDVDHFKRINDEFGHAVGDEVLRRMAINMDRNTRAGETLCRLGGEEFLIICPLSTIDEAVVGAERIRQGVEAEFSDSSGRGSTISIGVAQKVPYMSRSDDLLIIADDMLYKAKRRGRNRMCSTDTPRLVESKKTG